MSGETSTERYVIRCRHRDGMNTIRVDAKSNLPITYRTREEAIDHAVALATGWLEYDFTVEEYNADG
jgi:hypothetical protein